MTSVLRKCVYWLKWKLTRNTIKTKLVDVKSNTYFDSCKRNKRKGPKFKVGNNVRLLKLENILQNFYTPNLSQEVFAIKKVKNTVPWTYFINNFKREEIVGVLYKKELQRATQK